MPWVSETVHRRARNCDGTAAGRQSKPEERAVRSSMDVVVGHAHVRAPLLQTDRCFEVRERDTLLGLQRRQRGSRPPPVALAEAGELRHRSIALRLEARDRGRLFQRITKCRSTSLVFEADLVVLHVQMREVPFDDRISVLPEELRDNVQLVEGSPSCVRVIRETIGPARSASSLPSKAP